MITRDIFTVLRGDASSMQLILAAWLGALIGFVPGTFDHLGLLIVYACLLLVLNANLGVALSLVALGKLASLLLMPVSFAVGRWLIDGPASETMAWAFQAPVLALLDLEYYAVTGGIVLGTLVGLVGGVLVARVVSGWRKRFARLEENSERYNKVIGKFWTGVLLFVFVGDRDRDKKVTYKQLIEERFGSPIRWPGVAVVAVFLGGCLFAPDLVSGPLLAAATRDGLESVNGATVDLSGASLDTRQGQLVLDELAMADVNDLASDLFRATRVEADGDMRDLLRGRMAVDRVVVVDGANGAPRQNPGELLGDADEDDDDQGSGPGAGGGGDDGEDDDLFDIYVKEGAKWQERLEQLQEWLEALGEGEADGPPDETLEERLEREIEELGYAGVRASHLLGEAPLLVVREVLAEGVVSTSLPGELLDIRILNLSTDPELVEGAPRLVIRSRSGALDLDVALGGPARPASENTLRLAWTGLSTDAVAARLSDSLAERLAGGTLDLSLDGRWQDNVIGRLDLPLTVTLRDVQLEVSGSQRAFSRLELPLALSGSLADLHVELDDDDLQQALRDGLEGELRSELDRRKQEAEDELRDKLSDKLEEELGGGLDPDADAQEQLEAQAKQKLKEKAAEEVGGLLGGLFGDDDDDG